MALEFRSVTKEFTTGTGQNLTAVNDISFRVGEGEFVSVVGPSGCGKSTILSMTAGLYQPTHGEVFVSDDLVGGPTAGGDDGPGVLHDLPAPGERVVQALDLGGDQRLAGGLGDTFPDLFEDLGDTTAGDPELVGDAFLCPPGQGELPDLAVTALESFSLHELICVIRVGFFAFFHSPSPFPFQR